MKTLVQTTLWAPSRADGRLSEIAAHVNHLSTYTGTWDLLVVNNCGYLDSEANALLASQQDKRVTYYERYPANPGWSVARNRAFTLADLHGYDLVIAMDCDTYCTQVDWVEVAQELSAQYPALMVCQPACNKQLLRTLCGTQLALYGEWVGNINVLTRKTWETVGGYDSVTFPAKWGYHDCEYGRRLLKAGLLEATGPYPGVTGLGCAHEHASDYEALMHPQKLIIQSDYIRRFRDAERDISSGVRNVYFPYGVKPLALAVGE